LKGLPHTIRCITNNADMKAASLPDEIDPCLNRARQQLQQNPALKSGLVFVVDGFNLFKQGLTESRRDWLLSLLRQKGSCFHFIAAGTPFDFQSGNNPIADTLKQSQAGVFFGNNNSQGDLSANFNIKLKQEDFKRVLTPGSAFFVQKMRYRVVQLATCQSGEPSVEDWVNQIKQRVNGSIQQTKGVI
jgi:hypothetical protein